MSELGIAFAHEKWQAAARAWVENELKGEWPSETCDSCDGEGDHWDVSEDGPTRPRCIKCEGMGQTPSTLPPDEAFALVVDACEKAAIRLACQACDYGKMPMLEADMTHRWHHSGIPCGATRIYERRRQRNERGE